MKKRDIVNELKKFTNGSALITRADLARFFGIKNPRHVDKYLRDKDSVSGKYYFIKDIAEELADKLAAKQ